MDNVKMCARCKEIKEFKSFAKNKNKKDGLASSCKECVKKGITKYNKICSICKKEYKTHNKKSLYCSLVCSSENKKNREYMKCDFCNSDIEKKKSKAMKNKNNFCSLNCSNEYMKTVKGEKHKNYSKISVKCDFCRKDYLINNYRLTTSKKHFCSRKCFWNYNSIHLKGANNPVYGKILNSIRGENSPHWKNTLTKTDRENKRCLEGYKSFVLKVFRRDNFTCKICGYDKGKIIEAHHLNGYNWDKENRTNPENGITLCKHCHNKFHKKYGNGDNTKEQFEEFLQSIKIDMAIQS